MEDCWEVPWEDQAVELPSEYISSFVSSIEEHETRAQREGDFGC